MTPCARHRGFTLVEMLVSLGIFAVITGVVLANFRVGAQGDELRISSQLVASAIRRTQTSAVGGELEPVCGGGTNDLKACPGGATQCPGGTCSLVLPRGYGIRFDTAEGENRRMTTFVDGNGNKIYDAGEELRSESVSSGPSVELYSVAPVSAGALDIVFVPPKPTAYFNGVATDAVATITVRHSQSEASRSVTMRRITGQVSAD